MALELKRIACGGLIALGIALSVLSQGPAVAAAGRTDGENGQPSVTFISLAAERVARGLGEQARISLDQAENNLDRLVTVIRQPVLLFAHPAPLLTSNATDIRMPLSTNTGARI